MKFYKVLTTVSLALVCMIFASCDEKNPQFITAPTDGSGNADIKSFPMTEGSYWITENYATDQDGNRDGDITIDSTVVGGEVVEADETGMRFIDYSKNKQNNYVKSSESVMRTSDDKLYTFGSMMSDMIDMPIDIPGMTGSDEWTILIDFKNSIWEIARIEITKDDSISFGGMDITGEMDILGRSTNNTKDFTIDGTTVNAKEYIIDIEGELKISIVPIPISIDRKMRLWFAEGVGMVQQYTEPSVMFEMPSPGEMRNLIRYNIK